MPVITKASIITNIIRIPFLKNILILSLGMAILFPTYSLFSVYPAFTGLLVRSTEDDAIRAARHLARIDIPETDEWTIHSFSDDVLDELEKFRIDFQLEGLKVFSKSGEILYSTNPQEIGHINREDYFREIVAKKEVYTNVVQKDASSMEGRMVSSDVVETYVPLSRNDRFSGAFEIYYDITSRKERLNNLLSHSSMILFTIAFGLLGAVVVILFRASRTNIEHSEAEIALKKAHGDLERRVEARTAELSRINKELLRQIDERTRAERALRESEKRLHTLSSYLLSAQERERRRIALELHDELGQSLTVMKLQLRSIERGLGRDQGTLKKDCESTLQYVDQIIENVRRISRDLSPSILEDLGLTAALRWLVEDFAKHSDIKVSLDIPSIDNLFSNDAQILIYRIFQEAFTNIGKHAKADNVSVVIDNDEGMVNFLVEDDGKGFDMEQIEARYPTERSLGLVAMDERARMLGGLIKISGHIGRGTRISFSIPIDKGKSE